jgi:hypothetical protein
LRHDAKESGHKFVELSGGSILKALSLCGAQDVDFSGIIRAATPDNQSSVHERVDCFL